MKIIKILGILLLMQFQGCYLIHPKWVDSVSYGKQAIKKAYHLSRKEFVYDDIIDTTAIYLGQKSYVVSNRTGENISDEFTAYDIILFSGKGMALIKLRSLEIPKEIYNNQLFIGQYCFYTFFNSKVKLEIYNFDSRMFEYWFGKVEDNGDIYFYKSKGRPFGTYKRRISYTFRKTNIIITKPLEFPE
jgi:hypothetical protein